MIAMYFFSVGDTGNDTREKGLPTGVELSTHDLPRMVSHQLKKYIFMRYHATENENENGVMTTPKRHSILSLIFTC